MLGRQPTAKHHGLKFRTCYRTVPCLLSFTCLVFVKFSGFNRLPVISGPISARAVRSPTLHSVLVMA